MRDLILGFQYKDPINIPYFTHSNTMQKHGTPNVRLAVTDKVT